MPNIVSVSKTKKSIYDLINIDKKKIILFSASWITPNKKIEKLINLDRLLDKKFILIFFGNFGHDEKYNKKIKKLINQNQKKVFFLKARENIQEIMYSVDYVISMCTTDSFNRIAAEGMIEKKVVLVVKNTAPEEFIINNENGFIGNNLSSFKKFINKTESDKYKKKNIGLKANKTIRNNYSKKILQNNFYKILKNES